VTQYVYTAVPLERAAGAAVRGTREARDERELREALRAQGLLPVSVRPNHVLDAVGRSLAPAGVKRSDRLWFFATLATMLESRVPIAEAVSTMEGLAPTPKMRHVLADVASDLRNGSALSDAVEQRPGLVQPHHVALLRSGERSGQLDRVAGLVARSIRAGNELRRTLVSKLIYPALLLVIAVVVLWALGAFVVPRFAETLSQLGGELPWQTAFTLTAADVAVWALPIAVALIAVAVAFRRWLVPVVVRRRLAERALTLPIVGPLIWNRHAAAICETMATMIEGGADALAALDQSIGVVSHPVLRERLVAARRDVREGADLGESFRERAVLPGMLAAIVAIGLRSGELSAALRRGAEQALEAQDTTSQRLLTLLQPAVTIVMAGLVTWVVYALFVGMMAINESAL
jgi:type II secretory pathway component PulF